MKLNYDPNIRWATHRVKITLGNRDYRTTRTVEVGGNCRGLTVIDTAVEDLDRQIREAADEKDEHPEIWLTKRGAKLLIEADTDDEEWLQKLVIKVEIVDLQPDKKG